MKVKITGPFNGVFHVDADIGIHYYQFKVTSYQAAFRKAVGLCATYGLTFVDGDGETFTAKEICKQERQMLTEDAPLVPGIVHETNY
jgi:hypothetical protein